MNPHASCLAIASQMDARVHDSVPAAPSRLRSAAHTVEVMGQPIDSPSFGLGHPAAVPVAGSD